MKGHLSFLFMEYLRIIQACEVPNSSRKVCRKKFHAAASRNLVLRFRPRPECPLMHLTLLCEGISGAVESSREELKNVVDSTERHDLASSVPSLL